MTVLYLVLTALGAYFLGGLNGAIIASKTFFNKDVRNYGSHNAGLSNFYRTFGLPGLTVVLLTDIGKSVLSILLGYWLLGLEGAPEVGMLFAGFCLMLGHFYPVYYQFRGGKGVMCVGVLVLMVDWRVGVICWLVFLVVVTFSRFVSLGSIIGVACFPILMLVWGYEHLEVVISLLCALAVIIKHIPNIRRLAAGTESRLNLGRPRQPGQR